MKYSPTGVLKRLPLLADGDIHMGLRLAGLGWQESAEEWNIAHPDLVQRVHEISVYQGCNLVCTNSLCANRCQLERIGADDNLEELNRRAAELAKECCTGGQLVAGTIGPTGKFADGRPEITAEQAQHAFAEQARVLREAGVDCFLIQQIGSLKEMIAAVTAVAMLDRPVMAAIEFIHGPDGYRSSDGRTVTEAYKAIKEAKADLVGTSGGNGIHETVDVLGEFRKCTAEPLVALPSAEIRYGITKKVTYRQAPGQFRGYLRVIKVLDVGVLGGGRGTTADHVGVFKGLFS